MLRITGSSEGNRRQPAYSAHKGSVMQKAFACHDVITKNRYDQFASQVYLIESVFMECRNLKTSLFLNIRGISREPILLILKISRIPPDSTYTRCHTKYNHTVQIFPIPQKHRLASLQGSSQNTSWVTYAVRRYLWVWYQSILLHSPGLLHRDKTSLVLMKQPWEMGNHYADVIMTTIASQITSLTVVYSTVYSDANQRKHQSSASLAFVWGIHRDRWIPRTKGQLRGKCFHLMTSWWILMNPSETITRPRQRKSKPDHVNINEMEISTNPKEG